MLALVVFCDSMSGTVRHNESQQRLKAASWVAIKGQSTNGNQLMQNVLSRVLCQGLGSKCRCSNQTHTTLKSLSLCIRGLPLFFHWSSLLG